MSDTTVETLPTKLVTNQMPESLDVSNQLGESPLFHADLGSIAKQGPQEGGVHIREHALKGLLTLRCAPTSEQQALIESLLGVALPMQPLTSVTEDISVRWISPDEWLIIMSGEKVFELESLFAEKMIGHYALVNISGGSTVLEVSGDQVIGMMKKSVPVDLHLSEFPVGKVVSTLFAKSGAIICRLDEHRFELVIRRSFADYLWLWIQDASREYGFVVEA